MQDLMPDRVRHLSSRFVTILVANHVLVLSVLLESKSTSDF